METAGASRPLNGIHDHEREDAREPPEQISGRSLGQVAEVLTAPTRKGCHFSSCSANQSDQGGAEGTTRMATRDSVNVTSLNGPTMGLSTTAQEYTTSGPHRQVPCSQESRSPSPDRTPFCLGLLSEDRSKLSTPLLTKWLGAATSTLLRFAMLTLAYITPLTIAAIWIALKKVACVLLSWFHTLLLFTIRKFLVILLGGLIRIWVSCIHRRPTSTPVHSNFDKGPSDGRMIPNTLVLPHTPDPAPSIKRLQCECCLSDYPASSIVHCPGMHSVCVDCLSSYVAEQAPHLADASVAEVVCSHSSGCGRAFDAAVLQVLPEAVLRQLLDLVALPISRKLEGRPAEAGSPLVRVKVERGGGDGDTLFSDDGRSLSPTTRLEDAMSRCTVSLGIHDSPEASPARPYLNLSDADSDVNDYARSLSAFIHLRREQDCGPAHAEPPTPMRPPLAMIATTPQARRDFATAPPLDPPGPPSALNQHAASAQSAFQLQVDDDSNFQDPYAILERMRKNRDNAQARLRNAKKAFDRDECERTRRKVELETRQREEARERVAEAERAVEGYEKEGLSLSLTP